jgi:signal transduction histidine kinase
MKQIFWNLATNALKSMPEGGTLSIRIDVDPAGGNLEVTFEDEGVGMDEELKERYFQPFSGSFQEGTGLGAAIVYRLVEEHGGKIHLDSSVAEGTRIRITIPYITERAAPVEMPQLELRAAGG